MNKKEEVKQLLLLHKMKCFSLNISLDDTEVEDAIIEDLKDIEQRILELVE